MDENGEGDICRVCRMGASASKPLHYPCVCTGSIKYIHQDCLVQWLKHSKKEYCELCSHKFIFKPVYSPDMPPSIPLTELFRGLGSTIGRALRFWLHYTMVVVAWLGVVPLTAYRIYRCLFSGSIHSLLTLPMDILSMENIFMDCLFGGLVVALSMGAFVMLLWLREQIGLHGGPEWLREAPHPGFQMPQLGALLRNRMVNRQPAGEGAEAPPDDAGDRAAVAEEDVEEEDEEVEQNEQLQDEADGEGQEEQDGGGGWNADVLMEELTWEKFLGLDGSFVFLEHVFWIISLNTSFLLVFAFCPFHLGHMMIATFGLDGKLTGTNFDGFVILFTGYTVLAFSLIIGYELMKYSHRMERARRTCGLSYIAIKVTLLLIIEIGFFPLICGWWLDICSLPLFALTPADRKESFLYAPGTATFLHWLAGMLYVFYFAAFVILARELIRPGVLWFLRNINDPNFQPIKEMIHLSVFRHVRRFTLSLVVFGSTVMMLVWVPVQLVKRFTVGFIPFNVSLNSNAPLSEMSLELLLLQVILPAFLEQGHARRWLKAFLKQWLNVAAYVLDLRSYLIGDVELLEGDPNLTIHVDNEGRWQHGRPEPGVHLENTINGVGTPVVRAYFRPNHFLLRMVLLLTSAVVTFVLAAFLVFTIPVSLGRLLLGQVFPDVLIHELYTCAAGFYLIWLCMRVLSAAHSQWPMGVHHAVQKLKTALSVVVKVSLAFVVLVGVMPLLLGLLFELVVVIPLRVPLDQTPLLYVWQDWALGVLHLKILCAVVMVGPEWWLKTAVERAYQNGILHMDVGHIMKSIAYPIISSLLVTLTLPFVLTVGLLPSLGIDRELSILCLRRIYPTCVLCALLAALLAFQGKQFAVLYEKIKNEKYLIGKILVNYEKTKPESVGATEDLPVEEPLQI